MDDYRKSLALAIRAGYFLKNAQMSPEDSLDLADYILAFFGYSDEIIDNALMSYERDPFYEMENLGILKTSQTVEKIKEGTSHSATEWTLSKWIFDRTSIYRLIEQAHEKIDSVNEPETLYNELFESASVEDLKNTGNGNLSGSMRAFDEEWYSSMKKELEEFVKSEKRLREERLHNYLSIFATMLSPDIKPLAYLAMEPGKEYTFSAIVNVMAHKLGCGTEDLKGHINIRSMMESLTSIGAVEEREIDTGREAVKVYYKSPEHLAFDSIAAYAVKAAREKLEPAGLKLSDVFSVSVAQKMSAVHSKNLFGLIKLLAENPGKEFIRSEVIESMGTYTVRHDIRMFKARGLLDYESFYGNGGSEGRLTYKVLKATSLEELHSAGFVKRPEKCARLKKAIELTNNSVGKHIDRFDVLRASGAEISNSSKYLMLLSDAGVLERKALWNTKRSAVKANENTIMVWNGLLSWLYGMAKRASLNEYAKLRDLDSLEAAVLKDSTYSSELQDYIKSGRLIDDCSAHFRYLYENRRIAANSDLDEKILEAANGGKRVYEIASTLRRDGAKTTYASVQWHIYKLLRTGSLVKDGNVYTTSNPKHADKMQ